MNEIVAELATNELTGRPWQQLPPFGLKKTFGATIIRAMELII